MSINWGKLKGLVPWHTHVAADITDLESVIVESGNFTASLQDDSRSDSESQTYSFQIGSYRKTGDLVNFFIALGMTSVGTLTTTQAAVVGGLPFSASGFGAANICFASGLSMGGAYDVTGLIDGGSSVIRLLKWSASSGPTALTVGQVSASGFLLISGMYRV